MADAVTILKQCSSETVPEAIYQTGNSGYKCMGTPEGTCAGACQKCDFFSGEYLMKNDSKNESENE